MDYHTVGLETRARKIKKETRMPIRISPPEQKLVSDKSQ